MKILYLSCHAILEYDELKLFEELGIEYFSLGSYLDPRKPVDEIRPALTQERDDALIARAPLREELTKEFVKPFDTVIVMHKPEWITKNWDVIIDKRVIWRSIGQSTNDIETMLLPYRNEGLQIVRYSPKESNIDGYIGGDIVIRFYKDPEEFGGWMGKDKSVMTIAQNMKDRGAHCNYDAFAKIAKATGAKLYGSTNHDSEYDAGYLTYEDMKQKMRDFRAFIYTGTQPASYTLGFIEAWMTGIPVVSIGHKLGNSLNIAGELFEVPDLINNGISGVVSDDIDYLINRVNHLQNNHATAYRLGQMGRKSAIALFGKETVKKQWEKFLCNT